MTRKRKLPSRAVVKKEPPAREHPPEHTISSQLLYGKFEGPLPPSSELERYEQTVPGAGRTIIEWASDEHRFRHDEISKDAHHQRRMDWADTVRGFLGLACGAGIAFYVLYAAFKLAFAGSQVTASIFAAIDLTAVSSVFVIGRIRQ